MVKRMTGENSPGTHCAYRSCFVYKFLEFAAAPHRAALQLSMKNKRELY